ncbi:hypothetical protein [Rhizobium leguminosarum]|uniref:hypothetical protein n=1 Tax=Rhizobium leguminosarum TaxID=384 RepID=UPI001C921E12|nr:hypothetical protein [Rhizobium leguminosarum]MBY2918898.1 hypothetical protein [Rhizobium leguminosarum]MBY2974507.1 hypothetical protein [Rhizobium leguminosarum]MBY2982028.1 hypothetical protein [Rhizobium leguminosarum]MBY3010456.1 hypothetical protein [Rhizobium leguminosarum]
MSENVKDTQRAFLAAKAILDGRDPIEHQSAVLVTTEHAIAAVLLACMGSDPRKAALMLNESLVQGIEQRLAYYAAGGRR